MDETAKSRRFIASLLAGGIVGAAIVGLHTALGMPELLAGWRTSEVATLVIGVGLIATAALVAIGSASSALYGRMLDRSGDAGPADPADLLFARRQAIVSALAGLLLIAIPAAARAGFDDQTRMAVAAGVFAVLALQTLINAQLWRDGDELTRRVIADSGAVSFWLLQFALFVWATLVMFGFAPEIDSWTGVAVLMAVYLVASSTIAMRRGFGQ